MWWSRVVEEFKFESAGELQCLSEAASSLDRIEQCRGIFKTEGLFITGDRGSVIHPAARLEQQHRALVLQACRQLFRPLPKKKPDWQRTALLTGEVPDDAPPFEFLDWWHFDTRKDVARRAWDELKSALLVEWIHEHPGARPYAWWVFDAPRDPIGTWPGCWYDGKLAAPRLRVGGTRTPKHKHLAFMPESAFGIFTLWITAGEVETFKLDCLAVDPNDPPTFESQAAYLKRHDLLLKGERPSASAFEPEAIEI